MCQYFIPYYGQILFHCTDITLFVYSFMSGGAFRLFPLKAMMKSAAVNIHVHVSLWTQLSFLLGVHPGVPTTCQHHERTFTFTLMMTLQVSMAPVVKLQNLTLPWRWSSTQHCESTRLKLRWETTSCTSRYPPNCSLSSPGFTCRSETQVLSHSWDLNTAGSYWGQRAVSQLPGWRQLPGSSSLH